MLFSRIIFKNYANSSAVERGLNVIFNGTKHCMKYSNSSVNFCSKVIRTSASKHFLFRRAYFGRKSLSHGYSSIQSAVSLKKENNVPIRSSFQEMLHNRKTQAHRSVLISVANKDDVPYAIAFYEKYGSIDSIFSYPGESENCFVLIEFSSESSTWDLLLDGGYRNVHDVFPVRSRIVDYEKKSKDIPSNASVKLGEERCSELSFGTGLNVSEVIERMFSNEKLSELDIRLRFFLCSLMKDLISGPFPQADVIPFGSSVNGVGKCGCDLDLVIRLYPEKLNQDAEFYFLSKNCNRKQRNLQIGVLHKLGGYFTLLPGVSLEDKIMHARVPILKMKHNHLNLDFDVSVNNLSAVLMSEMLHFCGEIDSRVRPLVHIVKKWARECNITDERPGPQISNFGLTTLVLFFLQTRKNDPILPPLKDAFIIQDSDDSCKLQYLKPLKEWQNQAALNEETLAMLLKEFLVFLSSYPFHGKAISLLSGETRIFGEIRDESMPLHVIYPLDEALNVTKNVSHLEFDAMCEKARNSAKELENNFNQTVKSEKDFSALLGIPSSLRIGIRSNKFDISEILEKGKKYQNRNASYRMPVARTLNK